MNPNSNNVLPIWAVIKIWENIYQIWWYKQGNSKLLYLVTSSIWGWTLWEIEDSDKLLLRDGEKRIPRLEYRPDSQET